MSRQTISSGKTSPLHLLTGEFPPRTGGVGDYTMRLSEALAAAGQDVHVWCPADGANREVQGVEIHNVLGSLSPGDLWRAGRLLDVFPSPRRLLVQWVPHAFGYRSMNLHFCLWIWKRAAVDGDEVEVMVHEPFLPFSGPARLRAAAGMHRVMTLALLRAASRIWLSIPAWEGKLRPYLLGRHVDMSWLPIPSNIIPVQDPEGVTKIRSAVTAAPVLIGHFGTYGPWISEQLTRAITRIMTFDSNASVLLLGRNGNEFRESFARRAPHLAERLHAPGMLGPSELSLHLQVCDVMIQPFPDGISTRRGTAMACLAHGLPVVSTIGELTESLWVRGESAALVPAGDANAIADEVMALLRDGERCARLRQAAKRSYDEHFAMCHTVEALLSAA